MPSLNDIGVKFKNSYNPKHFTFTPVWAISVGLKKDSVSNPGLVGEKYSKKANIFFNPEDPLVKEGIRDELFLDSWDTGDKRVNQVANMLYQELLRTGNFNKR